MDVPVEDPQGHSGVHNVLRVPGEGRRYEED